MHEHTGRCIRDVIAENSDYPADKKIAFISCVNSDEWYDEAKVYLMDLLVPEGYGVEIIDIRGAKYV